MPSRGAWWGGHYVAMPGVAFIQDLAVILVVAGVVGWMCQRVGLSVVVGFLVAGILIGPHTGAFTFVTDFGRVVIDEADRSITIRGIVAHFSCDHGSGITGSDDQDTL